MVAMAQGGCQNLHSPFYRIIYNFENDAARAEQNSLLKIYSGAYLAPASQKPLSADHEPPPPGILHHQLGWHHSAAFKLPPV
jgi:hypothetical protein